MVYSRPVRRPRMDPKKPTLPFVVSECNKLRKTLVHDRNFRCPPCYLHHGQTSSEIICVRTLKKILPLYLFTGHMTNAPATIRLFTAEALTLVKRPSL